MAKLTDSQKRRLGIVAKATGGKLDGEKISDLLKAQIPEGPYDETVTITCRVRGKKSADTTSPKFYGVPLNLILDLALGMMPGFTKDHMLRLRAVATEITKAEKEGREIEAITFDNAAGEEVRLRAEEVERYAELATERHAELEEESALLSEIAKEDRLVRGQVNTSYIEIKVRKGGDLDGSTVLKQTKEDAKANGEAVTTDAA